MGIFKEEIRDLEDLVRVQKYVFLDEGGQPEAADMGVFDTKTVREDIQDIISRLPDGKTEDIFDFNKKVIGRKFRTAVCWELDSNEASWTQVEISWFAPRRKKDKAYFTVILENRCTTAQRFKNFLNSIGQTI